MKTFISYAFLLITGVSFSQKQDSIKGKTISYVFKAGTGVINANKIAFSDDTWDQLTPGFQIPDSFLINPNGTDYLGTKVDDGYTLFSFSFVNNKEKRAGKNFRFSTTIHFGYGPEAQVSRYWFHEIKTIIDTLNSSQTGNPYYVIGNRRQDIQKYYRVKSTMIGLGERFALRPDRIFQFETGLDVYFLFAKPSVVQSQIRDNYYVEGVNENNYQSPVPTPVLNETQTTDYTAKMAKGLLVSVPFDISFALSKKNRFFKRVRLGLEVNYGIAFQFTPGKTSCNYSKNGALNLRYEFFEFRRPFQSKSQK
ncbi:hypothetical protein [Fluviicola chungangensis]|uniref:Uncharacterized protein n=1 Tax=Fluviicola chungangensis TaxID=2597671 RepID=A0A556N7D9_9FLAO|nr:hypothetical protein [Fluviicola chungangensis]TSJ48048.1 hypothetical protein FO442_02640 [Fluviicola chungangensis]